MFLGAPGSPRTPRAMSPAQAELRAHGTGWRGEVQAGSPRDPEGLSLSFSSEQRRGQVWVVCQSQSPDIGRSEGKTEHEQPAFVRATDSASLPTWRDHKKF